MPGTRPFLRDEVVDRDAWAAYVDSLRQTEPATDRERVIRLSQLGEALRCHPDHVEESVDLQRRALELCEQLDHPRRLSIVQLRLAISLQYADRHEEALPWFDAAERTIRIHRLKRLRDFVEQHRGKCLAETGRPEEAAASIREALRLRKSRRHPDPDLVESSERALRALGY